MQFVRYRRGRDHCASIATASSNPIAAAPTTSGTIARSRIPAAGRIRSHAAGDWAAARASTIGACTICATQRRWRRPRLIGVAYEFQRVPRPHPATVGRPAAMPIDHRTRRCIRRSAESNPSYATSEAPMNYWLMKSEPGTFGIDHWRARRTDHRMGRRAQLPGPQLPARDEEGRSRLLLSLELRRTRRRRHREGRARGYPDPRAFDPKDDHYDADSNRDKPRWYMVDVKLENEVRPGHHARRAARACERQAEEHDRAQARQSTLDHTGDEVGMGLHHITRIER